MAFDLYAKVTDNIVAMIEKGFDGKKMKPLWTTPSGQSPIPISAVSKTFYRGINTLLLWAAGIQSGYNSTRWATYRGWKELGCQVRRGEAATMIVFWRQLQARGEAEGAHDEADDNTGQKARMMARAYNVFCADQVDGWTEPAAEPISRLPIEEGIDAADLFARNTGAVIKHGGGQAFYVPSRDYVQMPDFQHFIDAEAYYAVLMHEIVHWTGHETRLNRSFSKRFGDQGHAMEELVAEIGSAFILASLGISAEPRADHADYVAGWLKALKNVSVLCRPRQ